MQRLVVAPEFWIEYQSFVLGVYRRAAAEARKVGLISERGRLLVFDGLVSGGPGHINRAVLHYSEKYPEGATDRPLTEMERIRAFGDILKSQARGNLAPIVARRVDTIVTGKGSIRGIVFDLDQLNVSTAG
jgi:hypothetical protein